MLTFEPFPKIGRLRRSCTITEKLDGTNAQLVFDACGNMLVGSRKREIFPEGTVLDQPTPCGITKYKKGTDNFAFAQWAYFNRDVLFEFLGEGRHYGEWYGRGIQRGYCMERKEFALFNTARFGPGRQEIPDHLQSVGLTVVPVLYEGEFNSDTIEDVMCELKGNSYIDGYNDPEGIIIYHHGTRTYSKVTYDFDDGKWRHES